MPIVDKFLEICDATDLDTSGTGLALIGNVIDLGVARDIGGGEPLFLVLQATTSVDSAADGASVQFELVSDAQAAIATDGTASAHIMSGAIAEATLAEGAQLVLPLPPEGAVPYERYLGLLQNVSGEAVTAGAINAFITDAPYSWKSTADAL